MTHASPIHATATQNFKKTRFALAAAALATLAACGGGGSSDPSPAGPATGTPTATTISGTAATGLPLVGTVTVKDAKGATKTVPISNGVYTVDVTGMTAPFLFRAEGTVGGQRHVIHSAATAADANGTINITPLTDLVVANIAGQLAANYFDNGSFGALTQAELDSEAAGLKAKLLPVLLALGVDASIDLLRTSFTPLSSALDKALDVLRVSVDPATNVATIVNIVTQQQITDDLATKAAAESGAAPLSGTGMETAADDIVGVRKVLTDFMAKFANGAPTPAELLSSLTSTDPVTGTYNFRWDDQNAAAFTGELAGDPSLVGASFTDVIIRKIDYTITASNTSPRAFIDFTHKDKNGVSFSRNQAVQLVKGTDGAWRMRGNARVLEINTHVNAFKDQASGCLSTGFSFSIEDLDGANSGNVASVVVTGPGLPAGGVRHLRPASGGFWPVQGDASNYTYLASNCGNVTVASPLSDTQIAAIPDGGEYTYTAYLADGTTVAQLGGFDIVYKERIAGRPLTLAEMGTTQFPSYTTSVPLASYTGGAMSIAASGLNPGFMAQFYIGLTDSMFNTSNSDADVAPSAAGTATQSLDVSVVPSPIGRHMFVSTMDSTWRELITRQTGQ